MAIGPGKYDDAATAAREMTEGVAVVLIVLGGKHGSGFSVQMKVTEESTITPGKLALILHTVADEMVRGVENPS